MYQWTILRDAERGGLQIWIMTATLRWLASGIWRITAQCRSWDVRGRPGSRRPFRTTVHSYLGQAMSLVPVVVEDGQAIGNIQGDHMNASHSAHLPRDAAAVQPCRTILVMVTSSGPLSEHVKCSDSRLSVIP